MQTCFLRRVRITTMLSPSILAILQPTLPSQRVTLQCGRGRNCVYTSIHPPLRTFKTFCGCNVLHDFNPRSSFRARHYITNIVRSTYKNCILHSLYVPPNEKPPGHLCPGGFSRSLVMKMLIYIKESSPKGSAEI